MSQKPYIIGISGGSASGKTTFAGKVANALAAGCGEEKVAIFHMDSYFKPREERPFVSAPVTGKMYVDDNHPLTADLPKLIRDLHVSISSAEYLYIIVEGLLVLYDKEIYDMLDLKLFVDCQADERIVRRLRRNMAERGLNFDEIAEVYLDMVRYRHDEYVENTKWKADLIINGSNFSSTGFDAVLRLISSNLSEG